MNAPHTAYIALGSNLGDRQAHLSAAIERLRSRGIQVEAVSNAYETAPVGAPPGTEHLRYLNAAAILRTTLTPIALLAVLLEIEQELGRQRTKDARNAPRNIDLDLLLYEDWIEGWNNIDPGRPGSDKSAPGTAAIPERICLPHPRMHQRDFVLRPLAEIAPQARHPVLGKTIAELLRERKP